MSVIRNEPNTRPGDMACIVDRFTKTMQKPEIQFLRSILLPVSVDEDGSVAGSNPPTHVLLVEISALVRIKPRSLSRHEHGFGCTTERLGGPK